MIRLLLFYGLFRFVYIGYSFLFDYQVNYVSATVNLLEIVMWSGLKLVYKAETKHYLENPIHDIRTGVFSFKGSLNTLAFLTTSCGETNNHIQILSKKRLWVLLKGMRTGKWESMDSLAYT